MVLPDGLNGTATFVFLICGGIVWALVQFGIIGGKKSASQARSSPGASEIVAITVDSRALDRLAGEAAGLTVAITGLTLVGRDMVEATQRQAERTEALTEELRETTREVRDLTREVSKARP